MDETCSRCTRTATHGLLNVASLMTIWYCTFHWNRIIRDRRIDRARAKSAKPSTSERPE